MAGFKGEARFSEPMERHTSLRIGGPAEAMVFPADAQELSRLVAQAHKAGVPVFFLGKGTNLLVQDGGIPGLVVNTARLDWIELEPVAGGGPRLYAGAGVTLAKLLGYCAENGLGGLEFLAGIPGTLGGAVAMNAGTAEAEIKDVMIYAALMDRSGETRKLTPAELGMSYRHASVPEGAAVVEAGLAVIPWPAEEVKERIAANIRKRKGAQPTKVRSAGSTFKNPPGYSAWRLIDMAGLRGKSVGAAKVSTVHTNFLINTGGATARDFRALMELVVDTVEKKLNVQLEPEIKIVGVEK